MKIGDTVRSTGKGKSKSWGNYIGKVSRIENEKVYVIWNKTSFEDEMTIEEVELIKNIQEVVELRFSDGMIIHTHGPLRIIELSDGWYLVGEGKLIPVKDETEGKEILIRLSSLFPGSLPWVSSPVCKVLPETKAFNRVYNPYSKKYFSRNKTPFSR